MKQKMAVSLTKRELGIVAMCLDYAVEQQPSQLRMAIAHLREFLKDGARTAYDCHACLEGHGIQLAIGRSLTRGLNGHRVRKALPARSMQKDGQWWWELIPNGSNDLAAPAEPAIIEDASDDTKEVPNAPPVKDREAAGPELRPMRTEEAGE